MSTGMNDRERAKAWFEARGVDCSGQAFSDFPIFSTLEAEFAAVRQEQHERTQTAAADDPFRMLVCAPDELPEEYHLLVERWFILETDKIKVRIEALTLADTGT